MHLFLRRRISCVTRESAGSASSHANIGLRLREGVQYQASCLVDELAKEETLQVFYVTKIADPSYRPDHYTLLPLSQSPIKNQRFFFHDAFKLIGILTRLHPDIVYEHELFSYTAFAAYYARRSKCRFIYHIASDYDVIPFRYQSRRWGIGLPYIEKKFGEYGLKRADVIVAQTERQRQLLWNYYGLKSNLVVPNFHPLPVKPIRKPPNKIRIVWVANFKPAKRPEIFVRLAEDLIHYDKVEFVMIGRPGPTRQYGDLHKRMGTLKNLLYLGELPIDQVNEILSESHIFISTSLVEGFPNTFVQAWMRKLPIVSAGFDPDDIMTTHKIGFCSTQYEKFREHVEYLIANPQIRQDMGERAHLYACKKFSMSNVAPLVNLIRELR